MFAAIALLAPTPAAPPDAARLPPPRVAVFDADGLRLPDGAVLRLGSAKRRHADAASVHWSADGKTLVTVGPTAVKTWNAEDGTLVAVRRLADLGDGVVPSADGRRFVRRAGDAVVVGDAATAAVLRTVAVKGSVTAFVPSPDGELAAVVRQTLSDKDPSTTLEIVRVADGRVVSAELADRKAFCAPIAFAPDGQRLYVQCGGATTAFDASTGKRLWASGKSWRFLGVSGDGGRLVAASADGGLRGVGVFDGAGKMVAALPFVRADSAALSRDGSLLAHSRGDDVVVRDGKRGRIVATLPDAAGPLAFAPDGKSLATAAGTVDVWDAAGKRKWPDASAAGHVGDLDAMAWSPDGAAVVTAGSDRRVFCWDARTGAKRWHSAPVGGTILGVAAVGDEVRAVSVADADARPKPALHVWNAGDGKLLRTTPLDVPAAWHGRHAVFGPADVTIIEALKKGGRATVYAAATGKRVGGWGPAPAPAGEDDDKDKDEDSPDPTAVSADGRHLAVGAATFRLTDGQPRLRFDRPDDDRPEALAWSHDGALLAAVGRDREDRSEKRRLVVWERASGRVVAAGDARTVAEWISWSPDGRSLLLEGRGRESRWFDLAAGRATDQLPPWRTAAGAFGAWSPARGLLAREADDGTVLLFDGRRPARGGLDADGAWADLASDDAGRAWRAVWNSIDAAAVDVLKRAKPAAPPAPALVAKLDAKEFREREAASKKLAEMGDAAGPACGRSWPPGRTPRSRSGPRRCSRCSPPTSRRRARRCGRCGRSWRWSGWRRPRRSRCCRTWRAASKGRGRRKRRRTPSTGSGRSDGAAWAAPSADHSAVRLPRNVS